MKASFEETKARRGEEALIAYLLKVPGFEFRWHYHPDYELTWIVKGGGKRLVGDSHEEFAAGDLVLIGPDLPHTWVSDGDEMSEAVVIQFPPGMLSDFLRLKSFHGWQQLSERSVRGLSFAPPDAVMAERLHRLPGEHGLTRVASLMHILDRLTTADARSLSSAYFQPHKGTENEQRINLVCRYVQQQFRGQVSIEHAAGLIHLSESAFCKFFKRITGMTFSDYVNEVRVGHACHQLAETDRPIALIAAECGFHSISYFNRVFLHKKKMRPLSWRRSRTARV